MVVCKWYNTHMEEKESKRRCSVKEVLQSWGCQLLVLVFAIAVIFVLPSCDKTEEFQGFLMSDGIVKGCGFLLGMEKNGQTNVLFVTCRHVLEERMLASRRNFLDGPSDGNAIFLNVRGAGFRYRKISNIEPSRWHLSKSRSEDIAWIELTEAECESFAGKGRLPVLAWLNGDDDQFSAVGEVRMHSRLGIKVGSEVEIIKLMSMKDMLFPFSGVLPLPYCKLAVANAYESSGRIEELRVVKEVIDSAENSIWMRLNRTSCTAHKNNSGSPVLYKRNVIGLVVAVRGDGVAAFQCLDPIFEHYGLSH